VNDVGAFPVGPLADDLTIERELLEAPSDEVTQLGGYNGPCIDQPARRPSLGELLDAWQDAEWGGEA